MAKKPIQGVAWYNILANPVYARQFNFIEVNVPDREALIVDGDEDEDNDCEQSDMVQVLLNMAYAPRKVVSQFVFGPGVSRLFKQMLDQHIKNEWNSEEQEETTPYAQSPVSKDSS